LQKKLPADFVIKKKKRKCHFRVPLTIEWPWGTSGERGTSPRQSMFPQWKAKIYHSCRSWRTRRILRKKDNRNSVAGGKKKTLEGFGLRLVGKFPVNNPAVNGGTNREDDGGSCQRNRLAIRGSAKGGIELQRATD